MPSSEEIKQKRDLAAARSQSTARAAAAAGARSPAASSAPAPTPAAAAAVNEYAPQVRIVDGKIVLDEGSLTFTPSDQPREYNAEVIEETGNHVTSSSYTNRAPADRWTSAETDVFYQGLAFFGTDFALISKLFESRNRRQIKNKYKREEKADPRRLHEALVNRAPINAEKLKQMQEKIRAARPEGEAAANA